MKRHHTLAFQELQMQIAALDQGQGSLRQRIEILACITQLISFEVRLDARKSLISIEYWLYSYFEEALIIPYNST